MIAVFRREAKEDEIAVLLRELLAHGVSVRAFAHGGDRALFVEGGDSAEWLRRHPLVTAVFESPYSYPLAALGDGRRSCVKIGSVRIGDGFTVIAGPCSVESREQIMSAAAAVKVAGATVLRGGAFKPRTSPYSFQGMGLSGLEALAEAGRENGLPVISEIVSPSQVEDFTRYTDAVQIGARNMQNYELLKAVGGMNKPVVLKRHPAATVEEFLLSAEYILAAGNPQVILCERGMRLSSTPGEGFLDIGLIPQIKALSRLPLIVDPSHASHDSRLVQPLALAALAAGADGLLVEVHPQPEKALSDAGQSLTPSGFSSLMSAVKHMTEAMKALVADFTP